MIRKTLIAAAIALAGGLGLAAAGPAAAPAQPGMRGARSRMRLKLKLAAISSAVALAAGLGVALAGPAAAATDARMCAIDSHNAQVCALTDDIKGDDVNLSFDITVSTAFDIPGVKGEIRFFPSGLCMQIHTDDTIWMNSCQGKASEEWTTEAGARKHTTVFVSVYDRSLCLNASPNSSPKVVNVARCSSTRENPNQEWTETPVGTGGPTQGAGKVFQ